MYGLHDLFLSLKMFSGFIHIVACVSPSLLFIAELYSFVWICHYFFH